MRPTISMASSGRHPLTTTAPGSAPHRPFSTSKTIRRWSQKNTGLPPSGGLVTGGQVMPTYYFRTHFTFNDDPAGIILYFTSYIDDGAVFYLNGAEIYRYLMFPPPPVILNSYRATGSQTCNSTFDAQTNCPL